MTYTFDKANANAPTTHLTQYFEMFGIRGIYHEGWRLTFRRIALGNRKTPVRAETLHLGFYDIDRGPHGDQRCRWKASTR